MKQLHSFKAAFQKSPSLLAGAAVLLLAAATPLSLQAEDEFADTFSMKDRSEGIALNGLTSEVGNVPWQATKNLVLSGKPETGSVVPKDSLAFAARIALPGSGNVVTVETDLRAVEGKFKGGWVALGIGNPLFGTPAWGNGVFIRMTADGHWYLAGDSEEEDWKSAHVVGLKDGNVPEFNPDSPKFARFKLQYKKAEKQVSAWVNGVPVVENLSLEGKGFTVTPTFVGITGFGQKEDAPTAANFSAKTSP